MADMKPKREVDFVELVIITIALGPFVSMLILGVIGFVMWMFGVLP